MPISPTPWTIAPYDNLYVRVLAVPDAAGLREVVALVNGADRDANAALICAAPGMAAAIRTGDWVRAAAIVAQLDGGGTPLD